jgi:hypothetical protein
MVVQHLDAGSKLQARSVTCEVDLQSLSVKGRVHEAAQHAQHLRVKTSATPTPDHINTATGLSNGGDM